jgi:DNA-binding transcriptional regulator YdaS (Cro superfamily)
MRLRAWVKLEGEGEMTRLARATGLSYQTIHALARDKHPASAPSARLICAATGGAVSFVELTDEVPTRRRAKRRRAA